MRLRQGPPAAALLVLSLTACAGAPRARPEADPAARCGEAWRHVDGLLADGLTTYLDGMRRYAAARNPELSVVNAEGRARDRASAFGAQHRPGFEAGCASWPEERVRCVLAAQAPPDLAGCGLEPLVRAFTDDVVAAYAEAPFDRPVR
jgi:hypothetical protein